MTRELAIKILSGETLGTNEQTEEAVKMAVEALKRTEKRTETHGVCLDMISRQAAIDALSDEVVGGLEKIKAGYGNDWLGGMHTAWRVLDDLPPAQQNACEYWDDESNFCALHRPSAQPDIKEDEDIPMEYFENGGI